MAHMVARLKLRDPSVNLSKLPFFGLYIGRNGFGGKK